MTDVIVVVGKRSVYKVEIPALQIFGKAMARREKQLITSRSEGTAKIVADAYAEAGGTPQYMTKENYEETTKAHPVIAFTDTKYRVQLDESAPWWRETDWTEILNPKATQEAAAFLVDYLAELGTPLETSA